ncbi:DUF4233 domain-containing protein [Agromyces marinus]|uniref:DUF4233 domain-containing protein n=1 Tax=Agromyces marinus TaxID=1389020 RepID=A0ABM8GWZ3_9MICO|nr:DUF4233 domain-containing protein [Agromyces marinus]UIP58681.1 hypothetical protein DSM26151_15610 [Agromyces marinus]BDZ53023.1 hypothetical protein GCM10025870_00960 [Agromyces marinus]
MTDAPMPDGPDAGDAREAEADAAPVSRHRRPRSTRESLGSIVLTFEIIVVFLAALVIWGLSREDGTVFGLPTWAPLAAGGVVILALIVTIPLLRFEWAFVLGWAVQVLLLASGLLNPAMFVVAALFGGMWAYCMIVGGRIDRDRAAAAGPTEPGKESA